MPTMPKPIRIMSQQDPISEDEPTREERKELIAEFTHHSGPLPSSQELAGYEKILPGLADRIMTLAENEQNHTTFIDKLERLAYWGSRFLAQASVVGIVILILVGSYYLIQDDYLAGGIVGIITAVGTVLTSIIKNSSDR